MKFEDYLEYKPRLGILLWKQKPSKHARKKKGDVAGYRMTSGYVYIRFNGRHEMAHRVAWYLKTGEWPDRDIDHKNHKKDDNRWCNLRLATDSQNQANRKLPRNNTSGYKGVSWHSHYGKYVASIEVRGKAIWLGAHESKELAAKAYIEAAKKYFGEFARAA